MVAWCGGERWGSVITDGPALHSSLVLKSLIGDFALERPPLWNPV